jgi:hypothetical protein
MTVQIKVSHNPTGHETWQFLSEEFQAYVDMYNRAIQTEDLKGVNIYFNKASTLQDIIINLFDAEIGDWYE